MTWGLGWIPRFSRSPARSASGARPRGAPVLVPAPLVFLVFMGGQDRFFARWLLPVYPLLCLLAAWAIVAAEWIGARFGHAPRRRGRVRRAAVPAGTRVLGPQRRRARAGLIRASWRASGWSTTSRWGRRWSIEPSCRPPGRRTGKLLQGTGNGYRWDKWPTSRAVNNDGTIRHGLGRRVELEGTTSRRHGPSSGGLLRPRRLLLGRDRLHAVRPRLRRPARSPTQSRYYSELKRDASSSTPRPPNRRRPDPVLLDFSFNGYPLPYDRSAPK